MRLTPVAECGLRHVAKTASRGRADLTFCREPAMLRSNRETHIEIHLTSSVASGYTTNLRCTPYVLDSRTHRRVRRTFCVRAVIVRHKPGRTPVGSIAQRLGHRFRYPSYLLCPHQRAS